MAGGATCGVQNSVGSFCDPGHKGFRGAYGELVHKVRIPRGHGWKSTAEIASADVRN